MSIKEVKPSDISSKDGFPPAEQHVELTDEQKEDLKLEELPDEDFDYVLEI